MWTKSVHMSVQHDGQGSEEMRVALVHDYLTQYGGAERVLEVLKERFPEAPVYTSLYDGANLPDHFQTWDIRQSPLALIPGATRTHRLWTPVYPAIFQWAGRQLGEYDLVVSDSSAWAHQANPGGRTIHVCYCHSPARFLYRDPHYLAPTGLPKAARPIAEFVFEPLRRLDKRAARRVTRYIANSAAVAGRIHDTYRIRADVLYPPVETARFRPMEPVPPEPWFLVVSRLVPHKWIDLAVRAATMGNLRLKVIGSGRALGDLKRLAGPTVEFLGPLDDVAVTDHLRRCQALVLPGIEDFGMTAVEVQAAGRPVIARAGGGALETIVPGETGLLFTDPTPESLLAAMRRCQEIEWEPELLLRNSARFDRARFLRGLDQIIAETSPALAGELAPA